MSNELLEKFDPLGAVAPPIKAIRKPSTVGDLI